MADKRSDESEVSQLISRSYNLVGKSSDAVSIVRTLTIVYDCICNHRVPWKQFSGGSRCDGTHITGSSDIDHMFLFPGIFVNMDKTHLDSASEETIYYRHMSTSNSSSDPTAAFLFINDSASSTGYARLLVENREKLNNVFDNKVEEVTEDTSDGVCLSSEKFITFMISRLQHIIPQNKTGHSRHGPSLKLTFDNIYGYFMKRPEISLEQDSAFAIPCSRQPSCMDEWLHRKRKSDWPNFQTVEKIKTFSWHFVPVGDPSSTLCSLEWRLSFFIGERELVWSFNDTQIHCLVILKRLKKFLIEPVAPDQVTSYILKTVVFWMSEETELSQWTPENLLERVSDCLSYLKQAIREHRLSHYFQRERNLFHSKLLYKYERQLVISEISKMQCKLIDYLILYGMEGDSILTNIWRRHRGDISNLISECKMNKDLGEYYVLMKQLSNQLMYNQSLSTILMNVSDGCDSRKILQSMSDSLGTLSGVENQFKAKSLKILDIQMAFRYYYQYICEDNLNRKNDLLRETKKLFERGSSFDDFTGILYLMCFHFCEKEFRTVIDTLTSFLGKKKYLFYTGQCSSYYGMELGMPDGNIYQTVGAPMDKDGEGDIESALDFIFSKECYYCLPYPLQMECAMILETGERMILIHPAVCTYFLLFFSYIQIGDLTSAEISLNHLEKTISDIGDNIHRYRSLNILGYSYSAFGRTREAMNCYYLSLQHSRRLPDIKNAALYHALILAFYAFKFYEALGISFSQPTDSIPFGTLDENVDVIYTRTGDKPK